MSERSGRGKRAAMAAAGLALITSIVVGVGARGWIVERWYLHQLESRDGAERFAAARELAVRGSKEGLRRAVEVWQDGLLETEDLEKHEEAEPILLAALEAPEYAMRLKAVTILHDRASEETGRFLPGFLGLLKSEPYDNEVWWHAFWGLTQMKEAAAPSIAWASEAFLKDYGSEEPWIYYGLGELLGAIGAQAVEPVLEMSHTLKEPLNDWAFASFNHMSPNAAPVLVGRLSHADPDVRWEAALALGSMYSNAVAAAPALCGALSDPDPYVRREAMRALVSTGARDENTQAVLLRHLGDEDWRLRALAVEGLGNAGVRADGTMPRIAQLAFDEARAVRFNAVRALGKLRDPNAVDLAEVLDRAWSAEEDPRTRRCAAITLGRLGVVALPRLAGRLLTEDPETILAALGGIQACREVSNPKAFADSAAELVPKLEPLLANPDVHVRDGAGLLMAHIRAVKGTAQ